MPTIFLQASASLPYLTSIKISWARMRSQRRTGAVAETSAAVVNADAVAAVNTKLYWQRIFAQFLAAASSALNEPYFYTLRSNGWKSLCMLTGLSPTRYSALLLECELVRIKRSTNGRGTIEVSLDKWKTYLQEHNLGGDIYGRNAPIEVTDASVKRAAIERLIGEDIHDNHGSYIKMIVLRVGEVETGNRVSNTAINNPHDEPPRMNYRMRDAKIELIEETDNLLSCANEMKMQDVHDVEAWVLMETTATISILPRGRIDDSSGVKRKRAVEGGNDEVVEQVGTVIPPTPSTNVTNSVGPPPTVLRTTSQLYSTINTIPASPAVLSTTSQTPMTPAMQKKFPTLTKLSPHILNRQVRVVAGIDLDLQMFRGMLSDAVSFSETQNEPLQYTDWTGNSGVRLIKLPLEKKRNGKIVPNVKSCLAGLVDALNIYDNGSKNDVQECHDEIIDVLLEYVAKYDKQKMIKKLRERRLIPRIMDEYDCAALLDESGIKMWQWSKIVQCLKVFMDVPQLCVSEHRLRALGIDHGEIKHGVYYYEDPKSPGKAKEEIRYWWKDPVYEFMQTLEGLINGYGLDPSNIDYIHIAHGGDHGKLKFRFASKLLLRMKNGDEYNQVFGLADVACRKDNGDILENTCMKQLMKGVNTIEESDILFSYDNDDDKLSLTLTASHQHASSFYIKPTSFMVGDLQFLATVMGKENFSSAWCNWCKMTKEDWQAGRDLADGDLWDVEEVKHQADMNKQHGYTDVRMKGIKTYPLTTIPFSRFIFSGLHAGIGIGNRLIQHLEAFIDIEIEEQSHEEFQLRRTLKSEEIEIKELREKKDAWNESSLGSRLLTSKQNKLKKTSLELKNVGLDAATKGNKEREEQALTKEISELVNTRDDFKNQIQILGNSIRDMKKKLEPFTKNRKIAEESVYTAVDRIFQKYGANRAHYFGRAFEGVDIRKIMASSDDLFGVGGTIREKLLLHARDADVEAKVNKICDDVGLSLKLWDGAFSDIHIQDPSPDHCTNTQDRIHKAMNHMREMGISITPKMHGMEQHVVSQMRNIPGGIRKLMEHWIEQYHQIGYRFDVAYCRVGSLKGQAAIRSRMEKRGRNPRVQMSKKFLEDTLVAKRRKRRSDVIENEKERNRVKQERRDNAYIKIDATSSIDLEKIEEIYEAIDCQDEIDDLDDRAALETKIYGSDINHT